jgi:hypothetical protein
METPKEVAAALDKLDSSVDKGEATMHAGFCCFLLSNHTSGCRVFVYGRVVCRTRLAKNLAFLRVISLLQMSLKSTFQACRIRSNPKTPKSRNSRANKMTKKMKYQKKKMMKT